MDLVRHLTLLTLRFNFCIRAEHIEGKRNDIAASLSRFQMDRFRELAPHANRDPCLVPSELLKIQWQTSGAILICRLLILQSGPTVQRKKTFIQFLSLYRPLHAQSLPTDEDTLIQYVAYLAKSVKHSTIKGYLAAVRHFHIRHGYQLNLRKFLRLHLVCRGIKRSQGSSTRTRLPVTVSHLKFFFSLLAIRYTFNYDSLMIWATMTLAFFGFMRLGELTCNFQFSSDAHLTPLDIIFHPSKSRFQKLIPSGWGIPF